MVDQNTQVSPPVSGNVDNDTLMGILSYLSILVLIPLLVSNNRSAFLNHHINQGINLLIVSVIGMVVLPMLSLWIVTPIWNLLTLVLVVVGIVNVVRKETKALPVIGNWFHLVK
jgi:uncharacterized membrane protein